MPAASDPPNSSFATTHWSLVRAAGRSSPETSREAREALCEAYWQPLYAFVRRRTADVATAQDLTQAFFLHVLEKGAFAAADPERGRFRAFLLGSVKNFLANERDRAAAQKRGGDRVKLAFDWNEAESRLRLEPFHEESADRIFDRQWAVVLLERVLEQLRAECHAARKASQFEALRPALVGEAAPYAEIAAELGVSVDAARQMASRLRKRYRDLLRAEVGRTVADPADVADEIRTLFRAIEG